MGRCASALCTHNHRAGRSRVVWLKPNGAWPVESYPFNNAKIKKLTSYTMFTVGLCFMLYMLLPEIVRDDNDELITFKLTWQCEHMYRLCILHSTWEDWWFGCRFVSKLLQYMCANNWLNIKRFNRVIAKINGSIFPTAQFIFQLRYFVLESAAIGNTVATSILWVVTFWRFERQRSILNASVQSTSFGWQI